MKLFDKFSSELKKKYLLKNPVSQINESQDPKRGKNSSQGVRATSTGTMFSGGPVCSPGRSEIIRESFCDSRTHGSTDIPASSPRQIISRPKSITERHSSLENPNFSPSMIERKSVSLVTNKKASTFFRQAI